MPSHDYPKVSVTPPSRGDGMTPWPEGIYTVEADAGDRRLASLACCERVHLHLDAMAEQWHCRYGQTLGHGVRLADGAWVYAIFDGQGRVLEVEAQGLNLQMRDQDCHLWQRGLTIDSTRL